MTTVATRAREIADLEGFDIVVMTMAGRIVPGTDNGVLGSYPYGNALKASKTVNDWKIDRFENVYPGYTCDVLDGDGDVVLGQLSFVRFENLTNDGWSTALDYVARRALLTHCARTRAA